MLRFAVIRGLGLDAEVLPYRITQDRRLWLEEALNRVVHPESGPAGAAPMNYLLEIRTAQARLAG